MHILFEDWIFFPQSSSLFNMPFSVLQVLQASSCKTLLSSICILFLSIELQLQFSDLSSSTTTAKHEKQYGQNGTVHAQEDQQILHSGTAGLFNDHLCITLIIDHQLSSRTSSYQSNRNDRARQRLRPGHDMAGVGLYRMQLILMDVELFRVYLILKHRAYSHSSSHTLKPGRSCQGRHSLRPGWCQGPASLHSPYLATPSRLYWCGFVWVGVFVLRLK